MKINDRDMRTAYVDCLVRLAGEYPNLVVLDSDLSASTGTQAFAQTYPDRFINCGIQEANMTGVAAGLSVMDMLPVIHSFASFTGRRMVDQVFLSCGYAQLNVRIVGADPGICAGKNGGTHMSLEDIGIMRTIPNMTIIDPCDEVSLRKLLFQSMEQYGVFYFRVNRKAKARIYEEDADICIGKANILREGTDVALIAEGSICIVEALRAAELLEAQGVSTRVIDMATVKPLDAETVRTAAEETRALLTIENHNILNGLGSAVAEVLGESGTLPFARIGVPDVFGQVGTLDDLKALYGINSEAIAGKALTLLGK